MSKFGQSIWELEDQPITCDDCFESTDSDKTWLIILNIILIISIIKTNPRKLLIPNKYWKLYPKNIVNNGIKLVSKLKIP